MHVFHLSINVWSFSLVSDYNVTFQEWMAVNDLFDAWPHLIHSTTIKFNVHGISESFNP